MGRNAHKKFYSKTYDHSYELVVKNPIKIKYLIYGTLIYDLKNETAVFPVSVYIDGYYLFQYSK